ncbi:MAG TPA: CpsB/CapC family capsule biosynthesis tyrosine phosphatase [Symbiobacteriaceae bacterium]|jgi:protein-tyrosine phosphatase
MIDLHAHILPGLDDGPETMESALALLGALASQGVKTVVAGAHGLDGRYNATKDAVLRATDQVNAALRVNAVDIQVLPGMELFLGFDLLVAIRTGKVMGLNDSRYLLVELPAREVPPYTERALFDLLIAGYRPILNHPERNLGIQQNPDRMRRLAENGVGAAVTAASLIGRMGREAQALARAFIREGVASLVVSDAHDLKGRSPLLKDGLAAARTLGKPDQSAETQVLS